MAPSKCSRSVQNRLRWFFWCPAAILIGVALRPAGPVAAQAPPNEAREARVAAYERDLKEVLQTQHKLTEGFQTLMLQDQALRGRIMSTAAAAQQQMQAAEKMPELRFERTPAAERNKSRRPADRSKGDDEFRVVDQSRAKAAMATGAMQLASSLPTLNANLLRTNAALAQIVSESEANRAQFRSLADPFGRRGARESKRAAELMGDALLPDSNNENAKLVLAFASLRLGKVAVAEKHLGTLVDSGGPWQDVAMAARGHLRVAGCLGPDPATRRQGAALLNKAIGIKSRNPEPLLFRALAYWQERKWSLVETDLKAALRLRPDHVDGLRLLAAYYAANSANPANPANRERRLEEAEAAARRACELTAERDPLCLEALAAVLACRGGWEAAIDKQRQCVAVADGDLLVRAEQRLADYEARKLPGQEPPYITPPPVAPSFENAR